MAGPSGGAPAGIDSGMLESMRQAEGNGPRASQGIGDAESIGIGGVMLPFEESQSLDIGFGGDIGGHMQKISGALNQPALPQHLGSVEPFGVTGVGVSNKDLTGLGDTKISNVAPGAQFTVPAVTAAPGLDHGPAQH